MSSKRAPSAPPLIRGFEYVTLVGSGGFSDVFLYQQQRPRRRVAVKVLLHEWSSESQRASFDAEADLMATLSTHPSIVTMYEADVADDGRPYLAMEYCSRPNLGARYRTERLSVAEALRIAVQISGAVETAHRVGILHRDIKPANILVTDYGHPALTDFGISSTVDDAARAEGMSIPWSPPESFAEPPVSGVATDIWALAATTYTLLAGRTPFEVPGGSNSSASLMSRIQSSPLAPTGRSDVPASLERVLGTAMAKSVSARYPTMLAFARALQQVQTELSLAVTPIDVLDETGQVHAEEPDDDGGTRLRQIVSIDPGGRPQAPTGQQHGYTPGAASPAPSRAPVSGTSQPTGSRGTTPTAPLAGTYQHSPVPVVGTYGAEAPGAPPAYGTPGAPQAPAWGAAPVEDTVFRASVIDVPPPESEAVPVRRRAVWSAVVAGVVLLGVAGGAFAFLQGSDAQDVPDGTQQTATGGDEAQGVGGTDPAAPKDSLGGIVPSVTELSGELDAAGDVVSFTWESPEHTEGDVFRWRTRDVQDGDGQWQTATETSVEVPADDLETCIEVVIERDGGASYYPKRTCVRTEGT